MIKKTYSIENDPNKKEEAEKYDNPIPSREYILKVLADFKYPVLFESISNALALKKAKQLTALEYRLAAMVRDAQIKQDGYYFRPIDQIDHIVTGVVRVQNDGTTTVSSSDKKQTVYIHRQYAKIVLDGDIVCACILGINHKGKIEARIDSIVKRNTKSVIGRYCNQLDTHIIQPVSKTMPKNILLTQPNEVIEPNTLIKAKIIVQPSQFGPAVASLIETIEEQSPILTAISIASKKHNLVEEWSNKTRKTISKLPKNVLKNDLHDRIDLREMPFVTIDGEDARDFDDAVYARKSSTGGWKLYVAIADVSYYVKPDSALDKEAQLRSTSVYFPGYVIPMLPEELSNELCSLKPKVDRLSLVCEMNVSKVGKLTRHKFYSAVINSHARLTYNQVNDLLTNNSGDIVLNKSHLIHHLNCLNELYKSLSAQRKNRGAIDFDTVETQILLDKNQHISSITPRHRNDAHRMIEECMLLANVAAAKFITKNKADAPFRVHNKPTDIKVKDLKSYLQPLGIAFNISKGGIKPKDYAEMLSSVKGRDDFNNIQLMSLKSMNQAIYTHDNNGHFGLAFNEYTHFTSPIRRYPDLLTHRTIKYILQEKKLGAQSYTRSQLDQLCTHASEQERNADSASKDVEKWLKCHFLQNRIGDVFSATIVHITGFGMFVELTENYIEGLVHIASISGDYYIFDEQKHQLIGKNSKKTYTLGQQLQVQLIRADMEGGHIDFEIAINGVGRKNIESYEPKYRQKNKCMSKRGKGKGIRKDKKRNSENNDTSSRKVKKKYKPRKKKSTAKKKT